MTKLIKLTASLFGIGYLPFAQGTFASLAGLAVFLAFRTFFGITVVFLVIIVGFLVCGRAERIYGEKDSKKIVLDDFSGMLLTGLFIPYKIRYILMGFVLFRIFDILKIYPIKNIEAIPGSAGIMSDDIVAGIYAGIIVWILANTGIC